ncbi:MAG TPA: hypothetical protein VF719_09560 [Abditibacteriaceae bacterium]
MAVEITEELKKFIHTHINSVEQLEVLLLLRSNSQQEWSAREVSQKLFIQPESAAGRLADLHGSNLLTVREEGQKLYRYQPQSGALDQHVGSLDRAYKERKDAVIRLIFSRPVDNIRVFSNAFRIRRDNPGRND